MMIVVGKSTVCPSEEYAPSDASGLGTVLLLPRLDDELGSADGLLLWRGVAPPRGVLMREKAMTIVKFMKVTDTGKKFSCKDIHTMQLSTGIPRYMQSNSFNVTNNLNRYFQAVVHHGILTELLLLTYNPIETDINFWQLCTVIPHVIVVRLQRGGDYKVTHYFLAKIIIPRWI